MFSTTLKVEIIGGGKTTLLEDIIYAGTKTITAKKGFDFDGFSAPKLFWGLMGAPLSGKTTEGAMFHDLLYSAQILPRKESDELFKEINLYKGVSPVKAKIIHFVARNFGWWRWYKAKPRAKIYQQFIHIG